MRRLGYGICPMVQHLFIKEGKGAASLEYYLIFSDCKSEFWW